jgi:hypothetical protein
LAFQPPHYANRHNACCRGAGIGCGEIALNYPRGWFFTIAAWYDESCPLTTLPLFFVRATRRSVLAAHVPAAPRHYLPTDNATRH